MVSPYFQKSREIADNFIRDILFIDDEVYTNKAGTHNLEAQKVVEAFTKAKKLCSLSCPQTEDDFDNIIEVAKRTDVLVLDWRIELDNESPTDDEEEVEEEIERGDFTIKILKSAIEDPFYGQNSLKLFLVFTGEPNLEKVATKLDVNFSNIGFSRKENIISNENTKIIVIGKPELKGTFKHVKEFEKWVKTYEEIPGFLLDEFAKMTEGLMSNFALECLCVLRDSTFRILQLFNKKLDAAYLGHKVLLPSQEDAEDLLVDLMKDSLGDLLHYSEISKTLDSSTIDQWLKENVISKKMTFLNKKAKFFKDENGKDLNLNYILTEKLINELIFGENSDVHKRFENAFKQSDGYKKLNKEQKVEFLKTIQINSSSIFSLNQNNYDELDLEFANLTHHKNLFKPSKYPPKLSLGVVLRGLMNNDNYFVCIQQRCDSVRLKKGETRKFLFLPLKPEKKGSANGFHFTDPNGQRLRLIVKTHGIRTIKFQDKEGSGSIMADLVGNKYIFKQYYSEGHEDHKPEIDEDFEWVFDLKDLHAQRISNDIARELSRVGLNESEWLRRWSIS